VYPKLHAVEHWQGSKHGSVDRAVLDHVIGQTSAQSALPSQRLKSTTGLKRAGGALHASPGR
jgi:hypothetical protein